jgi:hypothetical protein
MAVPVWTAKSAVSAANWPVPQFWVITTPKHFR